MDRMLEFLDALHGDVEVTMTEGEKAFIRDFTRRNCRPVATLEQRLEAFRSARLAGLFSAAPRGVAVAAAQAGSKAAPSEPCSPDEEVTFVFMSDFNALPEESWRAELKVPPSATAESEIDVKVTDANGETVTEGTLRVAGVSIPLGAGTAKLPFSLFLAGIKDTDVRLTRNGLQSVRGRLAFF